MLDLTTFINQVRTEMVGALPALLPVNSGGGVFEAEHVNLVPWSDLTLPFGVIICSQFEEGEWGLTNLAYEFNADLYVVAQTSGASAALRTQMETLLARFWPADPLATAGVGQILSRPAWDYSDSLFLNETLRFANRAQRAGMLRLRCVVGELRA